MPVEEKVRHLDRFAQLNTERKQHVYTLLHVSEGHRVLDVGCGVGADTLPLARLVGPTGHISGVDVDQASIDEANQRAAAAGVRDWVEHKVGDASALPFADNSFDACHSERVFMHLPNPAQAFAQMVRVTKPGGWIAVIDPDGATFSIDTPEADIERRIVPFWVTKHNNGYAGRQLYRYFKDHGLVEVMVEITAGPYHDFDMFAYLFKLDDIQARALRAGAVTRVEVERFRSSLEQAAAIGAFFATGNNITVVGRKP
jgi:ubiquinone/menaquinone biosynthesis C-methylase UbiE